MTYTPVCEFCRTGEPFYRSSCQGCQVRKAEAEKVRQQADKVIETTRKNIMEHCA